MTLGYIGLAVSFLLVALVLLTVFLRSNLAFGWKVLIIPLVAWYGLVALAVPGNFMGWAKNAEPPDNFIILGMYVEEPSKYADGGIYFWGLPFPTKEQLKKVGMSPKEFTSFMTSRHPRSYRIPYDKELHKKLLEAQAEQGKQKGKLLLWQRGMRPGKAKPGKDGYKDDSGFRLKGLDELFPKVEEERGADNA